MTGPLSTDLVTRMRDLDINDREARAQPLLDEGADEIERLRGALAERNERLLLVYEALTGQHRSTWPAAVESGS